MTCMLIVHNKTISSLICEHYSLMQLKTIEDLLVEQGTFEFRRLDNGLFPAAELGADAGYTGYNHVWVRDNIYVAFAHHLHGQNQVAVGNIRTLARYFLKHRGRFEAIIDGTADYNEPMNRPHIRFEGRNLTEMAQKWAHAENDALGYFLWLICLLHNEGRYPLGAEEQDLLTLFVHYFETIRYWQDEDSGHWEETRKVEASSIGVVVRGLQELRLLVSKSGTSGIGTDERTVTAELLNRLIANGENSLERILPAESLADPRGTARRYDAALLFLVFPMNVVSEPMGGQIVTDVIDHLMGDYGIRRYPGDSYWCADYKQRLKPEARTIDFSDNIAARDALLNPGEEAQWCIFDPIISIIHGERYAKHRQASDLQHQTHHFNRALGQLTDENSPFGGFKCPELYYLEEGRYVPNDTVPLLWTQANLWMAFKYMRRSLVLEGS